MNDSKLRVRLLTLITLLLSMFWGGTLSVSAQAPTADLVLNPSTSTVAPGADFDVDVDVVLNGTTIDSVDAQLTFDPNVLEVLNVTVTPGNPLAISVGPPVFNNTSGTIRYVAGTATPPSADFTLITVQFHVKADTTETTTMIGFGAGANIARSGTSKLGEANPVSINLAAELDTTPPVITLLGDNPLIIEIGGSYSDPGATASDDVDGDLTAAIVVGGATVNANAVGDYVVTYDVSDLSGNAAIQQTRTVQVVDSTVADTTPPVITLLGDNPLVIEIGSAYSDPGATASDNVDGDLTSAIVVGGATVNANAVGDYVVTYDVSDLSGNAAIQQTRTVQVVDSTVADTTPPVITLLGDNPLVIEIGSAYSDPGATASDDVDGDLSAAIVVGGATVNPNAVGDYVVTYDVSDLSGNAAIQRTRTVQVVDSTVADTTPPVITLLGDNPLVIEIGSAYSDPGATASDDVDGDLTAAIVVGGATVNANAVGDYVVTYDVSDLSGNAAIQQTRTVQVVDSTVVDTTPPVITLLGDNPLVIEIGSSYSDPGATASDDVDGDLTAAIVVGGATVNANAVGDYVVTYDVSDLSGNAAIQRTRTVQVVDSTVVDTTPPVITLLGDNPLIIEIGGSYSDPGATASDNVDGDLSAAIVVGGATVNPNAVGDYVVTYDVSDLSGNAAIQRTRTVQVAPATNPTSGESLHLPFVTGN